jgi:hypothetical protein
MDTYLRYEELSSKPNVEYIAGGKACSHLVLGFSVVDILSKYDDKELNVTFNYCCRCY